MSHVSWYSLLRFSFLAIILGSLSGVAAAAFTQSYLADYATVLQERFVPLRLSEERPLRLPTRFEESVELVRETVVPSVAQIYTEVSNAMGVYEPKDAKASAVLLTSDGWMVSTTSLDLVSLRRAQVVVGREVYAVKNVVIDAKTDVVFLKVDASNLPVMAFGKPEELEGGDTLFIVGASWFVLPTSLTGFEYTGPLVDDAETSRLRLMMANAIDSMYTGSAVTNAAGELVGIVMPEKDGKQRVLPLSLWKPAIASFLKEGKIIRSKFGASVIDLAWAPGLSKDRSHNLREGALIEALTPGGSAEKAGLKSGDVILELNGESVLRFQPLDNLLQRYKPQETVSFLVNRAGTEISFNVLLGE
ncbi:MAG: hypothetical protein UU48_C0002G0148 [Candidatus Uhrbacteria bacterium GW2011_GWF2_41_16]|uniref:PDZ domain-containing protein n=2 Tax=Candidatus Uhriibacteriota TaxID=1752732 RepID=A0A0G0VCM3_9BACT|nr:MAG: hypothetical protein UU35_C0002G0135 [Candidatus Uhrbacteria bacterium GW2011_GWC2_41_11]KKR98613.1 MAG: hypothetical protein UU48_C0002G0148 [Candidatus Uhrbacteria bacterium GW2011_GWF2_41_16]